MTFSLSIGISFSSQILLGRVGIGPGLVVLAVVIVLGILFDIIGVSATKAQEAPFHAMAAKKISGAREAIWIVRNADRVANFCNDVVGDICGTVSGAIGAGIAFRLIMVHPGWNEIPATILMTALIAAATVSGKAYGKGFAMEEADRVVHFIGRLLRGAKDLIGLDVTRSNRRNSRARKRGNSGGRRKG